MLSFKILLSASVYLLLSLANLVLVYTLLSSPPIHWWYDIAPAAGPLSVYVPGSGFSGFWFHLGALQSIPNLHDYEFYCYSSGCLSVVMAGLNMSIGEAYDNAHGIQQSWLAGNMTRFELVEVFLQNIFEESDSPATSTCTIADNTNATNYDYYDDIEQQQECNGVESTNTRVDDLLSKLNILVTSRGNGVEIVKPRTRSELVDALKQTTWIPFVTGDGVMRPDLGKFNNNDNYTFVLDDDNLANEVEDNDQILPNLEDEFYIDGGFSRMLHPTCAYDLRVPNTWVNMMYTLHPGMTQGQVNELWESGRNFDHPLLSGGSITSSSL